MRRQSCIGFPEGDTVVVLHWYYIAICDGDRTAAKVLAQHQYWHEIRIAQLSQAQTENRIAASNGWNPSQNTELWVWKSQADMVEEMLGDEGEKAIARAYKVLLNKGFLSQRQNPKYKWDHTPQFLFMVDAVQAAINHVHATPFVNRNTAATAPQYCGAMFRNTAETIPETTSTENTTENPLMEESTNVVELAPRKVAPPLSSPTGSESVPQVSIQGSNEGFGDGGFDEDPFADFDRALSVQVLQVPAIVKPEPSSPTPSGLASAGDRSAALHAVLPTQPPVPPRPKAKAKPAPPGMASMFDDDELDATVKFTTVFASEMPDFYYSFEKRLWAGMPVGHREHKREAMTAAGKLCPEDFRSLCQGIKPWLEHWARLAKSLDKEETKYIPFLHNFINKRKWEGVPPQQFDSKPSLNRPRNIDEYGERTDVYRTPSFAFPVGYVAVEKDGRIGYLAKVMYKPEEVNAINVMSTPESDLEAKEWNKEFLTRTGRFAPEGIYGKYETMYKNR